MGSRDLRDKYLTSSLLWDLGLLDDAEAALREMLQEPLRRRRSHLFVGSISPKDMV